MVLSLKVTCMGSQNSRVRELIPFFNKRRFSCENEIVLQD